MKYVVLLIVLVVAYSLWRNARIEKKERAAPPPPGAGAGAAPQEMVSCAVCAVHLPRGDALTGQNGLHYCSQEHRQLAGR
jgi:uncharacterized protein